MSQITENKRSILRGSFGSAIATLLARLLGLFRVILEARVLGGGALATSWQLAFLIPNLFRRLFGEGALAQALIPMLSHTEAEHGLQEVRKQLALVLSALTGLLIVITVAVSAIGLLIGNFSSSGYVKDAMTILPLMMPYVIFICLVGVMTAVVNTRKVFFLASLNALILNVVLIALLLTAQYIHWQHQQHITWLLTAGVLISGILQLLMLGWLLKRYGVFPLFQRSIRPGKEIFQELFTLTLPGIIGGGVSQLSFLIDRTIALYVGDYAVPALSYTERLVYLPIGIVAVALGSVLMADMSRAAANKRYAEMMDDMTLGLRYVWFFCAPLAIFMIAYREPLIRLLFMHGNFTEFNVQATEQAMFFYAMGIPAFCALKVILPGFYARKKMTVPLKISLACIVFNIPLSILLMFPLKQGGIALATVISQMSNNLLLLYFLQKEQLSPDHRAVVRTMLRSIILAAVAAIPACYYGQLQNFCGSSWLCLMGCIFFFGLVYLGSSFMFKAPELREFIASLLSRKTPAKEC